MRRSPTWLVPVVALLVALTVAAWTGLADARSVTTARPSTHAGVGEPVRAGDLEVVVERIEVARAFPGDDEEEVQALPGAVIVLAVLEARPMSPDDRCELTLHAGRRNWQTENEYVWSMSGVPEGLSCAPDEDWTPGQPVELAVAFTVPATVAVEDLELWVETDAGVAAVRL